MVRQADDKPFMRYLGKVMQAHARALDFRYAWINVVHIFFPYTFFPNSKYYSKKKIFFKDFQALNEKFGGFKNSDLKVCQSNLLVNRYLNTQSVIDINHTRAKSIETIAYWNNFQFSNWLGL